jgi:hypothetical protein
MYKEQKNAKLIALKSAICAKKHDLSKKKGEKWKIKTRN